MKYVDSILKYQFRIPNPMTFKPSTREKMLRQIASSVKEARQMQVGTNFPGDREQILTAYQPELDFLQEEIWKDRAIRSQHGRRYTPPPVRPL